MCCFSAVSPDGAVASQRVLLLAIDDSEQHKHLVEFTIEHIVRKDTDIVHLCTVALPNGIMYTDEKKRVSLKRVGLFRCFFIAYRYSKNAGVLSIFHSGHRLILFDDQNK